MVVAAGVYVVKGVLRIWSISYSAEGVPSDGVEALSASIKSSAYVSSVASAASRNGSS